jgi:predicted oxidoreductase
MHPALEGLLVGAGLAGLLLFAEYYLQRKIAVERAEQLKRVMALDQDQRKRISSMARFCLFIPPAFAVAFWLIFN